VSLLFLIKEQNQYNEEKKVFSTNGAEILDIHIQKKIKEARHRPYAFHKN
jgi:hypothetical protein